MKARQRLSLLRFTLLILLLLAACYDDAIFTASGKYTCETLPDADEVVQIVEAHQEVVDEILQVNPGWIDVAVDSMSCPQSAYLVIYYARSVDKTAIRKILKEKTFFNVPYQWVNW